MDFPMEWDTHENLAKNLMQNWVRNLEDPLTQCVHNRHKK